jgi:uncharacterized protein YgbK (DUF1537 family)
MTTKQVKHLASKLKKLKNRIRVETHNKARVEKRLKNLAQEVKKTEKSKKEAAARAKKAKKKKR